MRVSPISPPRQRLVFFVVLAQRWRSIGSSSLSEDRLAIKSLALWIQRGLREKTSMMIEYSRSAVTQSNFIPRRQNVLSSFGASWRDRRWITQSSFQRMETDTSGWNELMLRGTYFFVASRRWTCVYIYIYLILDWSRISTVDHLKFSCARWGDDFRRI